MRLPLCQMHRRATGYNVVDVEAASLLSTMLGMLILHEAKGAKKLVGCVAIVLNAILVVFGAQRGEKQETL